MSSAEKLAILRIELADIEPLVWRRVAVRSSTNLETLHKIIQAAMGWLDYHLWEFTVDDVPYGVPDPDDASWGRKVQRASTTKLAKVLDSGTKAFEYVYDMGDNWGHRVVVERIEPVEPDRLYPEFLGGERRSRSDAGIRRPGRRRRGPRRPLLHRRRAGQAQSGQRTGRPRV